MSVAGGPSPTIDASYRLAGGAYFQALRIPLLAGRGLTASDRADRQHVVVVNHSFAAAA